MKAEIKDGNLVITIPLQEPTASASGKTLVSVHARQCQGRRAGAGAGCHVGFERLHQAVNEPAGDGHPANQKEGDEMKHAYINSNPRGYDSDCAVCGGKCRDNQHGDTDAQREAVAQAATQKHAPCPWSSGINHQGRLSVIVECRAPIPLAYVGGNGQGQEIGQANARLIAAAPDLLQALEECITNDGAPAWNDKMMAFRRLHAISDIARAAIAKAKGEG